MTALLIIYLSLTFLYMAEVIIVDILNNKTNNVEQKKKYFKIQKIFFIIFVFLTISNIILLFIGIITKNNDIQIQRIALYGMIPIAIIAKTIYNKHLKEIEKIEKEQEKNNKTKTTIKTIKCTYCGIKLKENETRCPNCKAIIKN